MTIQLKSGEKFLLDGHSIYYLAKKEAHNDAKSIIMDFNNKSRCHVLELNGNF